MTQSSVQGLGWGRRAAGAVEFEAEAARVGRTVKFREGATHTFVEVRGGPAGFEIFDHQKIVVVAEHARHDEGCFGGRERGEPLRFGFELARHTVCVALDDETLADVDHEDVVDAAAAERLAGEVADRTAETAFEQGAKSSVVDQASASARTCSRKAVALRSTMA